MKFSVVTVFPEMIEGALAQGVLAQGLQSGLFSVETLNPRAMTEDRHRTVDDRPFGGGDGMVMLAEPIVRSIRQLKTQGARVIYLSPQGPRLNQDKVRSLARENQNLVLLCGRYGGVDQRALNLIVDEEISIGDYVLSGGELGALVLIDAVARWIPGVLGHQESAQSDSFTEGLLEAPQYTRPRTYEGVEVPAVLMSGNHAQIQSWRFFVSLLVTYQKRPDLFWSYVEGWQPATKKEKPLLTQLQSFVQQLDEKELSTIGLKERVLEFKRN